MLLVIGCNYHTSWQVEKSMRFVLHSLNEKEGTCVLKTRRTKKTFSTKISDLIFINTGYNKQKAIELTGNKKLFKNEK